MTDAVTLDPDITDWTITSLSGNYREFGGSIADNSAALLGATTSTVPNTNEGERGTTMAASIGYGATGIAQKSIVMNRIDPDLLKHLTELNDKRKMTNAINSNVTMEELGEFPVETEAEAAEEKKDQL